MGERTCRHRFSNYLQEEKEGNGGNAWELASPFGMPSRYCFHDYSCLASYFRPQLMFTLVCIPSARAIELVERHLGVCGAPEEIPWGGVLGE